jgi:hypothetical protein
MTKKERKKYGLLPHKIAESDLAFLDHGLCASGGSIYNKDTSQNTLSYPLLALTMIDSATGWFEIIKATNKSATSRQDLFHNTWLARYPWPQFIFFDNGSTVKFKHKFKKCVTIMVLKPNQLQVTTNRPQANAIIDQVHKVVNDMLRSFYLENNRENLEEDDPFDYSIQSTAWILLLCY